MKKIKKNLSGSVLALPLFAGCMIFYFIPFCMVCYYSMQSSAGRNSSFVGLANYKNLLENEFFTLAYGNTVRFLAIALPLILLISYIMALVLKTRAEQYRLLKSILLFPYIMPIVGTLLLVDILFSDAGIVNEVLFHLGFSMQDWLESSLAFWVVILLYLWKNTGYSVILLLSGLMTIPQDQYAVANLDGADRWQIFWRITMPQMWYSVFFAFLFSMINAFKCFREIFLIGGKHPNTDIYMLQHFLNNSFENLNYSKLSVASMLFFVPILFVLTISYGWVKKREV